MKIVRIPQVISMTGLSRSSIYRLEKEGSFPRRKRLGERMSGWIDDDITDWLTNLTDGGCIEPREATTQSLKSRGAA